MPFRARTAWSQIPGSHFVRNTAGQAGLAERWGSFCCVPLYLSLRSQGQELRLWLAAASWPSLVLYEHLHLVDEVPGNLQDLLGIVMLSSFIEELDDVGEVHVVVTDNFTVGLHQGQGNE